jgi:hypothetical protein
MITEVISVNETKVKWDFMVAWTILNILFAFYANGEDYGMTYKQD